MIMSEMWVLWKVQNKHTSSAACHITVLPASWPLLGHMLSLELESSPIKLSEARFLLDRNFERDFSDSPS